VTVGKDWIRLAACAVALGLSAPASATSWVQLDRWNWLDMDSVLRISGGPVTFRSYHGSDAPSGEGANGWVSRGGIECATRRAYWEDRGQLVPVPEYDEDGMPLDMFVSESNPTFQKLCR
jgi:hypothetical protein